MAKVLLVDDDPGVLEMIGEILRQEGHETIAVNSVAGARNYLLNEDIRLLITDLVMPEKTGIDLILELKDVRPDIKVLAISGGGGVTGRFDYLPIASLIGANQILKKPFSISELNNKVDELLVTEC